MLYHPRLLEKKLKQAFRHFPVVTVLGARQVGKSTLVENLFRGKMETVVFDPVIDVGNARRDPELFLQNHPPPVFLDEIQYAPELLPSLKRKVDRAGKNSLYILSGSQNLSVLKNITESLAGRTSVLQLFPMTVRELDNSSDGPSFIENWVRARGKPGAKGIPVSPPKQLYKQLWRGAYPKTTRLPDSLITNFWESYFRTYIERDIRTVAQLGSLQDFGRFFALLAGLTSQEINHNEVGRELGIDRKTALAWTSIAEATYQWISIPPFSRNPVKGAAGKPKGYFSDTGFAAHLQRISSPQALEGHPMLGPLFETFVVLEIIKSMSAWGSPAGLYHYRTYAGAEVDLILERDGCLFPVEIKAKTNPSARDASGFNSLRERYPGMNFAPNLIICSIESVEQIAQNTWAAPWWSI